MLWDVFLWHNYYDAVSRLLTLWSLPLQCPICHDPLWILSLSAKQTKYCLLHTTSFWNLQPPLNTRYWSHSSFTSDGFTSDRHLALFQAHKTTLQVTCGGHVLPLLFLLLQFPPVALIRVYSQGVLAENISSMFTNCLSGTTSLCCYRHCIFLFLD